MSFVIALSTSELIARVVKDHEKFTKRNLKKSFKVFVFRTFFRLRISFKINTISEKLLKRGFSRKDLNITAIREYLLRYEGNPILISTALLIVFAGTAVSCLS